LRGSRPEFVFAVLPFFALPSTEIWLSLDLFELTRELVDIESITNHEKPVVEYLHAHLSTLAAKHNGVVELLPAAADRDNLFVSFGEPLVTLSTHTDTVPPFFPSREDERFIWGRGACDAKGIIAAMIAAVERLLAGGERDFALLFVVGEERNSAGARAAAATPRGSRYLINGEPTENRLALGCKGALRFELIARGKLAHSAYPELGHSAIHALLDVLQEIRATAMPSDALLGTATLNVGVIGGGRAPNVIADEARAELMFRTVGDPAPLREAVHRAVAKQNGGAASGEHNDGATALGVTAREALHTPAIHLTAFENLPTTVVAFTTDIPTLAETWGQPFLIGPGSIHVAHTAEERIAKCELSAAVAIYERMVRKLLASARSKA
jgi:acetylornithine deacetylase